jgi:hypothetical protein
VQDGVTEEGPLPQVPGLVVQPSGGIPKVRKVYNILGVSAGDELIVHNNSLGNMARGVAERVLFLKNEEGEYVHTPQPVNGIVEARLGQFKRRLVGLLSSTTHVGGELVPCSHEEFPNLYKGRKQTIYKNAVTSLSTMALTIRDAILSTFVKAEKVLRKAPRIIQPRSPRYNVGIGVFLKPHEGAFYNCINRVWGEKVVAKGMNAQEVGCLIHNKWTKYSDPVAFMLDAKRFDQHVSIPMLEFEHSIYNTVFDDPELAELLSWQLVNKGKGYCEDGKLSYTVRGCRMSGDMNTSLGNTILMCAMVYSYMKFRNIPCSFVNNGDDCVLIMERRYQERCSGGLEEWFLELGFQMVVEPPVYQIEHIDFCQCRPVFDGVNYIMVRNLHRALSKDSMCLIDISTIGAFRKWLWAVGSCGLSLTGGIPVYQDFYSCYLRHGEEGKISKHPFFESGLTRMSQGLTRTYSLIDPRTRVSFWEAFGVTPDEQKQAEMYFASLSIKFGSPIPLTKRSVDVKDFGLPQSILYKL